MPNMIYNPLTCILGPAACSGKQIHSPMLGSIWQWGCELGPVGLNRHVSIRFRVGTIRIEAIRPLGLRSHFANGLRPCGLKSNAGCDSTVSPRLRGESGAVASHNRLMPLNFSSIASRVQQVSIHHRFGTIVSEWATRLVLAVSTCSRVEIPWLHLFCQLIPLCLNSNSR